jgi:hypothetical protein
MAEFEQNSQELTPDVNATVGTTTNTPKVEAPFREFKTQKDFDDFSAYLMRKGEEKALKNAKVTEGEATFDYKDYEKKYRKDLEAQIIADYERKAKMTAEERAEELAREREQQFRDREIALNRREAQVLLSEYFDEDEMDVYLDFITEDRDASLGKIRRVCDSQKAKLDKQRKSIIEELQANSPNMKFGDIGDVNALQTQYDAAKSSGNLTLMSSIIRQAQAKNITLQQ